jgi:hypothetical protein
MLVIPEVPVQLQCWNLACMADQQAGRPMIKCARCWAAHYCCHECELHDKFKGGHHLVCCTALAPKQITQMVYRASGGACGLALRSQGTMSLTQLVLVARTHLRAGAEILNSVAVSGFRSSLPFLLQLHYSLDNGVRDYVLKFLEPEVSFSLGHVERMIGAMMTNCRLACGCPHPSEPMRCPEGRSHDAPKFCMHLKAMEDSVDSGTKQLLKSLVTWVMRERQLVDSLLDRFEVPDPLRRQYYLDTFRVPLVSTLQKMTFKAMGSSGNMPLAAWAAAQAVDEKVTTLRSLLPPTCKVILDMWILVYSTSPFVGLQRFVHAPDMCAQITNDYTGEEMHTIAYAHMFAAHSCDPVARSCATQIFEGVVDLEAQDLQVGQFREWARGRVWPQHCDHHLLC